MSEKEYKCLYNHELLILFTSQTPYQSYRDNVTRAQIDGYVDELAATDVDALMCCPTAWRTNLWQSKVDPHWQTDALAEAEPLPECDRRYHEKAYYRARRYMIEGNDPVRDTLEAARRNNIAFFISYRMNDHHWVADTDCPTHNKFWRENKKYWLRPEGDVFNYAFKEVREYYFNVLKELTENYDIDGLELDFQRSPRFFLPDEISSGMEIMSEFVRRIYMMKERIAAERGKPILLCVRVPHTLELCGKAGLDVLTWDSEELIDMLNISSYFKNTLEIDIEGFRTSVRNAKLYGEMHFITSAGKLNSGFTNNVNRRTSRAAYQSTAFNYLSRGIDGLSFFNFAYVRDHYFDEPRMPKRYCVEPPFDILKNICDIDTLKPLPKHYVLTEHFGTLPQTDNIQADLMLYDDLSNFGRAVLRVESRYPCTDIVLDALVNGNELSEIIFNGELSMPLSEMALPDRENLRYFEIPLAMLNEGKSILNINNKRTRHNHHIEVVGIELGLY